jgi:hypothetical protein
MNKVERERHEIAFNRYKAAFPRNRDEYFSSVLMPVSARLAYPGHWTIFLDTASGRRLSLHLACLSGHRCGLATICPRRGGPISRRFRPFGVR